VGKTRCGCRSNLYSPQDICGWPELVAPQLSNTPRAAFAIPGRARCAAPDGHCVAVSVTGHTMAVRETRGLSGCAEHGAWAPKRRGPGLRRSARSRRPRSVRPASEHACGVFSRVEAHRAPQAREAGVPQTELDDFFRVHEVRASGCARPWIFHGSPSPRASRFSLFFHAGGSTGRRQATLRFRLYHRVSDCLQQLGMDVCFARQHSRIWRCKDGRAVSDATRILIAPSTTCGSEHACRLRIARRHARKASATLCESQSRGLMRRGLAEAEVWSACGPFY